MSRFQPYTEYREPDVPWPTSVPAAWKMKPLKSILRRRRETNEPNAQLLSVYRDHGVVPFGALDGNYNKPSLDLSSYQVVHKGDLVLNKMKTWQGSLAVSPHYGIVSPAYIVCEVRSKDALSSQYLHYLLRSRPYIAEYARRSYGIRVGQWDLRFEDFRDVPFLVPSMKEQTAIAAFLDRETSKIDTLIQKKQRLVELLNEKRAALISHVVTKGLDPGGPMRATTDDTFQFVPEGWRSLPIKRLWRSCDYGISASLSGEGEVRVLTMGHLRDGGIDPPTQGSLQASDVPKDLFLKKDDLLFNRTNSRDLVGKVGIVRDDHDSMTFASYLVRIRVNTNVDPEYANYLLNANVVTTKARSMALQSINQANLNPTRYGQITAWLPELADQRQAVKYINQQSLHVLRVISITTAAIERLQEYRAALISAAVTGQIDVRNEV